MPLPSCSTTLSLFRGATILFRTTFYGADNEVVQPPGAIVNLVYPSQTVGDAALTDSIEMDPPGVGEVEWSAEWDSRVSGPGPVSYSIHSTGLVMPYSVEDGMFALTANNANQPF